MKRLYVSYCCILKDNYNLISNDVIEKGNDFLYTVNELASIRDHCLEVERNKNAALDEIGVKETIILGIIELDKGK